jgi:hypothetical protein
VEIVAAILLFIAVCGALMLWDFYKPARFRTTYSNVDKRTRSGDGGGTGWFDSDGDGDGGGD